MNNDPTNKQDSERSARPGDESLWAIVKTDNDMNYDKKKYIIWDWKNPVISHWIINPGLVVNELLLGQTVPKVMLIERKGNKPFYQRSFIPCPHCGELQKG